MPRPNRHVVERNVAGRLFGRRPNHSHAQDDYFIPLVNDFAVKATLSIFKIFFPGGDGHGRHIAKIDGAVKFGDSGIYKRLPGPGNSFPSTLEIKEAPHMLWPLTAFRSMSSEAYFLLRWEGFMSPLTRANISTSRFLDAPEDDEPVTEQDLRDVGERQKGDS